ncbi:TusE/DsrC/DsvC family sulfur relay protein [Thiogranum longum]|jgi:tRNA 2-thiouridine synthesizing protein E
MAVAEDDARSQGAAKQWTQSGSQETSKADPDFPHAPHEWTKADADKVAQQEGLDMTDDHWDLLCALHEYYARHEYGGFSVRELHDALDEKFHVKGGYKFLYRLFPGGPVAQGCRLAGLEAPAGAIDKGFGSVV